MIGKKEETQSLFHYFDPHDLIPDDYILKRIDRHIDFSFIEGKVKHLYSHTGRRGVPKPAVVLKAAPPGREKGLVEAVFGAIFGFLELIFGLMSEKCRMSTKTLPRGV